MFSKKNVAENTKAVDLSYLVNFKKALIGHEIIMFHVSEYLICGKVDNIEKDGCHLIVSVSEARQEFYKKDCKSAYHMRNFLFKLDNGWFGSFIGGHLFVGPQQAQDDNMIKYFVILKEGSTSL